MIYRRGLQTIRRERASMYRVSHIPGALERYKVGRGDVQVLITPVPRSWVGNVITYGYLVAGASPPPGPESFIPTFVFGFHSPDDPLTIVG